MNHDDRPVSLRQGIQEITGGERLSARELAALRQLCAGAPAQPARRRWLGAAAAVSASALLGTWGVMHLRREDNAARMADEVAYNHLSAAPLDITSDRLDALRDAFAPMSFHLLDAQALEGVPGELLGGRFCSLASVPAALLRYRDGDSTYTVYQARFDPSRHRGAADVARGDARVVRAARGVTVCLCNIDGVLLAVASDGPSMTA